MTIKTLFFILLIVAATSISITAQTRPTPTPTPARPAASPTAAPNLNVAVPASKIAVIDTEMFGDEKAGIFRLMDAIKIVQNEFRARQQELQTMQGRINTLVEDIRKLRAAMPVDQKTIQAKQEEGTRVQQDLQTRQQRFDEDYSKRYREVTGPVSELIEVG